jgi:L-alanine-DL-glutamate epimerase-like enolase superfamily enzyme
MKITSLETIAVHVPLRPHFVIQGALGRHEASPYLLIRVHTGDGLAGLGEVSATAIWSGEDAVTAKHVIDGYLAPAILGEDPRDIERLTIRLRRAVAGNPFTKAGIEIALWDLLGKAVGLPLYRLLGGAVRRSVPIKMSVSGTEPLVAAQIAEWTLEHDIRALKVKVGIDVASDIARVKAVRETVGDGFRMGVDANGGWSVRDAIPTIRKLHEHQGIYFAEQPVAPLSIGWLAEVRKSVPVPLIADESCYTPQDAVGLAKADAADVLSIYVGKGGIGAARKIAAVAEGAGFVCTVGSNLELGIASAAMIHLAASTASVAAEEFPCDVLGPLAYDTDLLISPIQYEHGAALIPEGPGLGVELDEELVERYRV